MKTIFTRLIVAAITILSVFVFHTNSLYGQADLTVSITGRDTICMLEVPVVYTGSAVGLPLPITFPNPRWTGTAAAFCAPLNTATTMFTPPGPGTYNLTYTAIDGNFVPWSATKTIVVLNNPVLSNVTPLTVSICQGHNVTMTAAGCLGYEWYRDDCAAGPITTYVGSGPSYSFTANTVGSCKFRVYGYGFHGCPSVPPYIDFTVNVYLHPTADAGPDQTICAHSNALLSGSIGGSATMGTWTTSGTGTFVPNQNTLNATYVPGAADIASGSVILTLTTDDPPGLCPPASDFMILTITPAVANNIICCNQSVCYGSVPSLISGSVPTGGSGIYTYQWQNSTVGVGGPFANIAGATVQNYQPPILPVDTWYRRIVTSPPCSANSISNVVFIDYLPLLVANAGNDTLTCSGNMVTIGGTPTAYGGTPPYQYWWTSIPAYPWLPGQYTLQNPVVSPTVTTKFIVQVTDGNNCISSDSMVVAISTPLHANAGGDGHICSGNNGGSAVLGGFPAAYGGMPPYTYFWTAVPAYAWLPGQNAMSNPVVKPLVTTQFTLTVTDAFHCIASDNVYITVDPELFASAGPDQNLYFCGRSGAKIGGLPPQGTAWGGTPPYTYMWSSMPIDITIFGQETLSNPRVKPVVNTTYYVTVSDAVSCRSYDTVVVSTDLPSDFFNISTGLSEVDNIYKLQLYPNPTEGNIELSLDDYTGTLEINIRNIQGKLLFSEDVIVKDKSFDANIDLTKYPNGVYFIQVITDNNASLHKIIKQ